MADTASKHIDMTTGSLWRNIPLFALPVAATSILEQLSNLIATVIIGNFSGDQGTLAMAAVGSNVPLTSLMLNLFIGMSLGSNVVIANAIGRNDQNMVKRAVHTSILMALVGFVVIALGEIFAEPMLAALNVPAETMPLASLYLRVFLLSMPSILLYNFEAAIFRSVGITRMPLQALAVSTVLNIGLDLIFVPVLHWGVAGVAIATAIAYTVSAATLFIRLLKTDSVVRVTPRDLAIDPVALKRIVKIGLPAGIQSAVFAVANIIIQSAINSLGTEVMAASSAAMSLSTCATTCSTALARLAPPLWDKTTVPVRSTAAPRPLRSAWSKAVSSRSPRLLLLSAWDARFCRSLTAIPTSSQSAISACARSSLRMPLACSTRTCPATCAALASRSCPPLSP